MSQGNWGGGPPGGGGWGGGGPPGAPPGGGGYGPPPGGGGYGPPPGGGGYGPPPGGGGYGPPPGAGGYGAPPGGDFGAPPGGAMAPVGARAQFNGQGGNLLVTFLMWGLGPIFAGGIAFAALAGIGMAVDGPVTHGKHPHGPGALYFALAGTGMLIYLTAAFLGGLVFTNKFIGFRFDNLVLDGQKCEYKGTVGQLFMVHLVNALLISVTFGIYTPWALCRMWRFIYENTLVNGQPNRLTFVGDGAELLGRYILGIILTICTLYIYGAWFANDLFAFFWENTKLDGRGFGFRKDPGGFLGTYILTVVLTTCTFGIYYPWGICNIIKWETERVS